jgi:hypothetical protein
MILGVQRLGLQTQVDFDDQPGVVVDDPDGAIFAEASAIAEPQAKYRGMVESGQVSPAQMRGSGALGADMRMAQVDLGPAEAAADQTVQDLGAFASDSDVGGDPFTLPAPAPSSVASPAPAAPAPQSQDGLVYMPGGTQTASTTTTVKEGPQRSTQTRQVDASAIGQSLNASAGQAEGDYAEALLRMGADPAKFQETLSAIRSERAAVEKDMADQQKQKQQLDQQYAQASQVPEDAARLWGQPGFALSAAIGGFFSSLLDLKQARKGQQSLNLGARFWQSIDKLVDRDVASQRANKSSQLAMLERQLGSSESAISALKAQRYGYIAQELSTKQAQGMYDAQMREQAEKVRSEALDRVATERRNFLVAQAPVVTQQDATTRTQTTTQRTSTPGQWMSTLEMARKELGISPEQWQKGLEAKIDPSKERSPTLAIALPALQMLRGDMQTYREIQGLEGKVVTRDVFDKLSQGARKVLGDLGVDTNGSTAVTSEKLQQLDSIFSTKIAKDYGGVITDGDIERAQAEFGNSTTGKIRYLERLETDLDQKTRGALNTHFLGKGTQVLDLMRRGSAGISGLEAPSLKRRGSIQ